MIRIDEDQDCPSKEYEQGEASGTCWGDGHYLCTLCRNFRADFKKNPDLREQRLNAQGGIQFISLKPLPE